MCEKFGTNEIGITVGAVAVTGTGEGMKVSVSVGIGEGVNVGGSIVESWQADASKEATDINRTKRENPSMVLRPPKITTRCSRLYHNPAKSPSALKADFTEEFTG